MQNIQRLVRVALVFVLTLCAVGAMAADHGVVNINTAETQQLTLLPRVGPALAQRIIDYRQENGKFEQTTDLLLVRGIGDKTFALMEPFVTVKGETTLQEKLRVSDIERQPEAADGAEKDER